jgi:hypothetical protein
MAENSDGISEPPKLIPRPDGRGALLSGGVPGHDGSNAGRKKSAVRELCRQHFESIVPDLAEIAKGSATREWAGAEVGPMFGERVRAADVLGKYGLGEAKAIVSQEVLEAVGEVAGEYVPADRLEAFTNALVDRLKELE